LYYNQRASRQSGGVYKKEADVMAIGIYFSGKGMSASKYGECVKLLKKAGAGHPSGRSYHACFGPKDNLMVFDVWSSQAAFDKFGKTLMPILQQLGIEGQPAVMPVHNVILPAPKVTSRGKQSKTSASRKKR
jgi:hypothetical protein